jgi:hypothetical protein
MPTPKRPKIQTGRLATKEVFYYLQGTATSGKKKPGERARAMESSARAEAPKNKVRRIRMPKTKDE